MQSFLQGMGVLFLFLIVLVVLIILGIGIFLILLITSLPSMAAIDEQVKNYIANSIQAITKNWDAQELRNRATPQMHEFLNSETLSQYLALCEKSLGQLTLYKGSKGSLQGLPVFAKLKPFARIITKKSDLEASENLLLGEYTAEADFERGIAQFEIQLCQQDEEWLINFLAISINNFNKPAETEMITLQLGEKTTMENIVNENKKKLQLEKQL